MAVLSRFFRFGTPVLVVLCAAGQVSWWLVLVPVVPVWCSFVTSTYDAHRRARIIRYPRRPMTLDEAASERRFLLADVATAAAEKERVGALYALAAARDDGDANAEVSNWRKRGRLFVKRASRRRSA